MGFSDILVHVHSLGSTAPVTLAIALSKRFGGHLTGLYALNDVAMFKLMLGEAPQQVRELIECDYADAGKAERGFRQLSMQEGVAADWQIGEGDAAELLCVAARLKDLILVGQTEAADPGWDVAERVVLTTSTPTMVVPATSRINAIGERVLVAWNGSREAALAVRAARPFLANADHVTVLVGENREKFSAMTRVPPVDIGAYLQRHGIAAEMRPLDRPDAEAGLVIVDAAQHLRADLIVMGAYGRSRLREWVLGGATRHLLKTMPVPVLMAH